MPESHLNFRGLGAPKKVIRRAAPSPDAGTRGKTGGQRAQTSPARYRQIAKSRPQPVQRPYTISGGRHPEKFVDVGDNALGIHGQVVDQRGSVTKARNLASARTKQAFGLTTGQKRALVSLLMRTPVGEGVTGGASQLVWDKAKWLYGGGRKPLTSVVNFDPKMGSGASAYTERLGGDAPVALSPETAFKLVAGGQGSSSARSTLLHEWAHSHQHPLPKTPLPKAIRTRRAGQRIPMAALQKFVDSRKVPTEGGAEAFSEQFAPWVYKQVGWNYDPKEGSKSSGDYERWQKMFRKQRGLKGVARQFQGM